VFCPIAIRGNASAGGGEAGSCVAEAGHVLKIPDLSPVVKQAGQCVLVKTPVPCR
jgi:hypothetical protein